MGRRLILPPCLTVIPAIGTIGLRCIKNGRRALERRQFLLSPVILAIPYAIPYYPRHYYPAILTSRWRR